jgi:hypothetical protein
LIEGRIEEERQRRESSRHGERQGEKQGKRKNWKHWVGRMEETEGARQRERHITGKRQRERNRTERRKRVGGKNIEETEGKNREIYRRGDRERGRAVVMYSTRRIISSGWRILNRPTLTRHFSS